MKAEGGGERKLLFGERYMHDDDDGNDPKEIFLKDV
jgi:hypothetical protein